MKEALLSTHRQLPFKSPTHAIILHSLLLDQLFELLQKTLLVVAETLLVVVGRGSSDPDANSNVTKITRMLVEGFGFGWGETVYSGVTFPLVEPGLRQLTNLGFKHNFIKLGFFVLISLNSGKYLPACLINQTGTYEVLLSSMHLLNVSFINILYK